MTTTAAHETTTLNVAVDVRFSPAGLPLALRHDGHLWVVTDEPVHWSGADIEFWQVQGKLSSTAAPRTFLLHRDPGAAQWLLESVS
ncbi:MULTISPECIES: hypothetical protein [Arthrobacter]|uniref:Uncharacterized protein n=1 Tax=Arthrobacter terricola TaxID=2547396 RepID=A0A4R5KBI3_9MICC|nr:MULTISPECIES: hypothetical protein [Arthrobacter]MBT8162249.1 hypothetical protein [Arthrobacter sp. GN70]TDF92272.1 hypothetical protein E1809_18705 [Arthrobacter terricola]